MVIYATFNNVSDISFKLLNRKNTTACLLLKLILYWMIFMVNPSKSYFVQDNILKDRPFFWGKTEFFKNVFRARIFSYKK